jgi:hypothetical protein
VFYVMDEYLELVLLLRERKCSSLRSLFEDAQEVEENIHSSRRIQEKVFFENLHAYEQEECQYILDLKQEDSKYDSHLESNSSTFTYFSMDKDACLVYDQFSKHVEHMITDDCIDSYMFLANRNYQCDLNPFVPLSCDHHDENKETIIVDDHNLILREPKDFFSRKGSHSLTEANQDLNCLCMLAQIYELKHYYSESCPFDL